MTATMFNCYSGFGLAIKRSCSISLKNSIIFKGATTHSCDTVSSDLNNNVNMKKWLFKILIIGLILIASQERVYSQANVSTWLTLTYNGFLPKVFEVDNNSASDLYNKAKKWCNSYYPNIQKELISDSLNYQIKVRSFKPEAFYCGLKRNLYDMDYTLIISFKEGKYRLQVELNAFFYNPRNTKYRAEGESQETGWDQREFYITEKELDPRTSPGNSELNFTIYEISSSLYKAMTSENINEQQVDENDDW